jgi:nucleoid DNA-binding protein
MAKKKAAAKKKAMGKKKVTGKKKVVGRKKAASKKKAAAAGKKPPTKSEILAAIADDTELSKKEVSAVLESLSNLIGKNIGSRGPGYFNLPGLMKIKVNKKPAVKARKGINPFTGEEMMFKAKPARKVVKIAPLKSLKEMV